MASAERHALLDGAPLSLLPEEGGHESGSDRPVLLLLGDGPVARAVARLAAECGFAVDMAVTSGELEVALPGEEAGAPEEQEIPGLGRRLVLAPEESPVERCAIGRRHYVCLFPRDEDEAASALEDVLASHAFYVGLWATRAERDRIWAALRAAGVPDAELAAVRCPLGLGELGGGPVASAVGVVAELLAARAGSRQRLRPED